MGSERGIGFLEDNDVKKQIFEFCGQAMTAGHDPSPVLFIAMPVYFVHRDGNPIVITDENTNRNILPLFTTREGALREFRKLDATLEPENVEVLPDTIRYLAHLKHACYSGVQGVCIDGSTDIQFLSNLVRVFEEWFPRLHEKATRPGGVETRAAITDYLRIWSKYMEGRECPAFPTSPPEDPTAPSQG